MTTSSFLSRVLTNTTHKVGHENKNVTPSAKTSFTEGQSYIDYKSYDGKTLNIGDIVYQIHINELDNKPHALTFKVTGRYQDGKIKIVREVNNDGVFSYHENIVLPTSVHSNLFELIKLWILDLENTLQIKLPKLLENFYQLSAEAGKIANKIYINEELNKDIEI